MCKQVFMQGLEGWLRIPPGDEQVKAQSSWVITEGCLCNLGESHVCLCGVRFEGFLTN